MATFENFFKALVKDVQVELTDEFDRNFERKGFFNERWPDTKFPNTKGSLMVRNGAKTLKNTIKSNISDSNITWTSWRKDAALHNDGGEITVTAKMKRFFWAMYYKANNAITYSVKKRTANNTIRNRKLSGEAAIWKNLALMKVGKKIKIPRRRFIGHHPQVDRVIKTITDEHVKDLEKDLFNALKNRK